MARAAIPHFIIAFDFIIVFVFFVLHVRDSDTCNVCIYLYPVYVYVK